jgi:hypothetical protein
MNIFPLARLSSLSSSWVSIDMEDDFLAVLEKTGTCSRWWTSSLLFSLNRPTDMFL